MTYQEATTYLFESAPLFQNIGAGAYKEGLENTLLLDAHFGHPHRSFHTIHVAGTNGKGSVSHSLAAILQSAGYRTGLYTSPHLVDFRERIRVNGKMIPRQRVVDFVEQERGFFEPLHPSFFELATALAFKYFKEAQVDVAVIEVGLGGRLDCTNIIRPDLSIVTNISFDHVQFLGSTLPQIAAEKAGIIKSGIPVVIGETNGREEVRNVFLRKVQEVGTQASFADELGEILSAAPNEDGGMTYHTLHHGILKTQLGGLYQCANTATILAAVDELRKTGYAINEEQLQEGLLHVCNLTGLMGRWQKLHQAPDVICDTGHNVAGFQYTIQQLERQCHGHLHIIIGMVSDKDVNTILTLLPKDATYYFTQASVKRAMPAGEFATKAQEAGLKGKTYKKVATAYRAAMKNASPEDLIFVGGSNFIVADMLKSIL
ncbi:MAG: bifunctional folylpolyglutamate synthase/dihydrofolate synthase [Bacteroidaceae bacterium]|nr:bifunctional folylpolyglutamate synthase/dihydrofolate synthase [Bacteroidaceae bacterium]